MSKHKQTKPWQRYPGLLGQQQKLFIFFVQAGGSALPPVPVGRIRGLRNDGPVHGPWPWPIGPGSGPGPWALAWAVHGRRPDPGSSPAPSMGPGPWPWPDETKNMDVFVLLAKTNLVFVSWISFQRFLK